MQMHVSYRQDLRSAKASLTDSTPINPNDLAVEQSKQLREADKKSAERDQTLAAPTS